VRRFLRQQFNIVAIQNDNYQFVILFQGNSKNLFFALGIASIIQNDNN
jgi:hypothetical protein